MNNIKIYHNPRCSKSREALKLLNIEGLKIDIILYMENKLTFNELETVLSKLNISPIELIRKNEKIYKEIISIKNKFTDTELINFMIEYPNLIQRPIVQIEDRIFIARPPEKVLEFLSKNK
ncbi:MAG: arsenate reductase (glutaredoxin) [Rhodospirillaceae bacterium]|nr:arsenate reductase (glutaredoxin) [Rhodospirillaceae bacterium]|tara:strand:- start:863 stop:1225 length:363 start_codon:yes stop_codon:yes gene_type:complete